MSDCMCTPQVQRKLKLASLVRVGKPTSLVPPSPVCKQLANFLTGSTRMQNRLETAHLQAYASRMQSRLETAHLQAYSSLKIPELVEHRCSTSYIQPSKADYLVSSARASARLNFAVGVQVFRLVGQSVNCSMTIWEVGRRMTCFCSTHINASRIEKQKHANLTNMNYNHTSTLSFSMTSQTCQPVKDTMTFDAWPRIFSRPDDNVPLV